MTTRRPQTLPRPAPAATEPTDNVTGRRPRPRLVVLSVAVVIATLLGWTMTGHSNPLAGNGKATEERRPRAGTAAQQSRPAGSITWQDFAGVSLPVSRISGPRCTDDHRARCFADTDDGAALAAVHLLVRTFPFAGSTVFAPTIREQTTGPDVDAFARLTQQAYDEVAPAARVSDGGPIASEGGWVAGYRLEPSTALDRTVDVLIRQTDSDGRTGFAEYAVHLRWRDTDWALVAPPWGDWRNAARTVPTPNRADYLTYDGIA